MLKEEAPYLEIPNDLIDAEYPQKFVYGQPYKKTGLSDISKAAPTLDHAMHGMTKYPAK